MDRFFLLRQVLIPSNFKRLFFFLLFDVCIMAVSLYLSFELRFEFGAGGVYQRMLLVALPIFLVVKIGVFFLFNAYNVTWRYFSIRDLTNIALALPIACLLLAFIVQTLAFFWGPLNGFPRSIFYIDLALSFIGIAAVRLSKRIYLEDIKYRQKPKQGKLTLIIGAGNTGDLIIRDTANQKLSHFNPVAILDDDPKKEGAYIRGIKVVGNLTSVKAAIQVYHIQAVIIAIPSLSYQTLRTIYDAAKETGVSSIKIVPRLYDFHHPHFALKSLEDIRIEDLMGRQTVEINSEEISEFLRDKRVLVTGAGGSIGSEIVTQICGFQPQQVVLLDCDETELHHMQIKLQRIYADLWHPDRFVFFVADVRDVARVNRIFEQYRPEIVFHAAAYKHVPMMEYNATEAVKVNIFGTSILAEAAKKYGVEKFIMISTDKAVMPTSVMGATKRIAEDICKAFDRASDAIFSKPVGAEVHTEYISVRFGNVLGSRGSMLPLFMEQLRQGGPLTVTHPEMKRYFMTIPEAVSLVLQASLIGKGGEVMVLDMGEPIKIVTLAEELIKLQGLIPYEDVQIEFIGMRPGEKLFEELLTAEEGTLPSRHKKIFIAKSTDAYSLEDMQHIQNEFEMLLIKQPNPIDVKNLLKKYVKHYEGIRV